MIGSDHRDTGKPCQDASAWRISDDGLTFLGVVADGAGSADMSDLGASVAVQAAIQAVWNEASAPSPTAEATAWVSHLKAAILSAREAVENAAKLHRVPPRALASTLIIAVATPAFAVAAQIGDGATVFRSSDGETLALTVPQTGEYINQTTFLTSDRALDNIQTSVREGGVTHLAVFSDGLQMLCLRFPGWMPHGPFFEPFFQLPDLSDGMAKLVGALESERVREHTGDDLTLVVAGRPEQRRANSGTSGRIDPKAL